MTAQAPDDRFASPACPSHSRGEIAQALNCQNIRERVEIIAQRRIFRHRRREIFDRYFAWPRSERVGADSIKVDWLQIVVNGQVCSAFKNKADRLARGLALAGGAGPASKQIHEVECPNNASSINSQRICPIKLCVS